MTKKSTSSSKKQSQAGKPSSLLDTRVIYRGNNPESFKLAGKITVSDYKHWKFDRNRNSIADFIYSRFSKRYLTPLASIPRKKKSGFCMMAIACLTIEALESFRQGWKDSEYKSKSAFCFFFDKNDAFAQLRGHSQNFYEHVRCGILHQAETTGGWRIHRDKNGTVFNEVSLVVNANAFLKALKKSLQNYRDELKAENWESKLWKNAIKKIDTICDNCKRYS